MGKRGRRRALCENKKDEDESYYYDDSFDEHANLKNTTNIENIYSKTEEKLFKLCKDYAHKCDHLKYIGPSDIRRFDNEYSDYIGFHASCAPIVVEFLECALKLLIDEYKNLNNYDRREASEDRRFASKDRREASKDTALPYTAKPYIQDQYDLYLESFKYQLCIKLSKYYTK